MKGTTSNIDTLENSKNMKNIDLLSLMVKIQIQKRIRVKIYKSHSFIHSKNFAKKSGLSHSFQHLFQSRGL